MFLDIERRDLHDIVRQRDDNVMFDELASVFLYIERRDLHVIVHNGEWTFIPCSSKVFTMKIWEFPFFLQNLSVSDRKGFISRVAQ